MLCRLLRVEFGHTQRCLSASQNKYLLERYGDGKVDISF